MPKKSEHDETKYDTYLSHIVASGCFQQYYGSEDVGRCGYPRGTQYTRSLSEADFKNKEVYYNTMASIAEAFSNRLNKELQEGTISIE